MRVAVAKFGDATIGIAHEHLTRFRGRHSLRGAALATVGVLAFG